MPDHQRSRSSELALLSISATILTLQVLQTKIFAYSLDPITIYLAIGICLLGLGASGTVLALRKPIHPDRVHSVAGLFAALAALLVPAAHVVFARTALEFAEWGWTSIGALTALASPYFCMGMVVALLLGASPSVGRSYAFNLGGSALGCILVFPLIDYAGAERGLFVVSIFSLACALLLVGPRLRNGLVLPLAALFLIGMGYAPRVLDFPPDKSGQLAIMLRETAKLEAIHPESKFEVESVFSRWDRTTRVDVWKFESSNPDLHGRPVESSFLFQDASAGSILLGTGDDLSRGRAYFEETIYGAAYIRGKPKDVLAIGLGGAVDVMTALYFGAERITGVEINATTVDLVRRDFADYLGHPYQRDPVTIHEMDGRTFLRSTDAEYDVIQMSGVDTKSMFAPGSLALNENFMYTQEAMTDALSRLRPDGLLSISRFGDFEINRLTSVIVAAFRRLGVEDPRAHLVAISQGHWRALLARRTPFPEAELNRIAEWVQARSRAPDVLVPAYEWIGLRLGVPATLVYAPPPIETATTPFFQALAQERLEAFFAASTIDLSPPTDDRPYFFFLPKPADALTSEGLRSALGSIGRVALIAAFFILVPLFLLRRRGLATATGMKSLAYFTCLGIGFMLIEIGLIHWFVLLLGHQTHAISVVLLGLLVGASLGSAASRRLAPTRKAVITFFVGLVVVVLAYAFLIEGLFHRAAGFSFPGRLALSLGLLLLLGGFLGVPFPTGLRAIQSSKLPLIAWAIGVNGFASVLGASAAPVLAMVLGLKTLLLLGACLYVLAAFAAPIGRSVEPAAP